MKKPILFAIFTALSSTFLTTADPATGAIHSWEKVEIVLTAARDYPNPYFDVDVWVDLSGPGFSKRCHGFWDGGKTYRVRVAATAPGDWKWKSGSNQADDGLNGKAGSFQALAWTEAEKQANPIPVFNQEPWFLANDSAKESWKNRCTMYSCLLRGGLGGVVYEAMGQTRAVRETSSLPPGTHGLHQLMWVSVLWKNAEETQHARTFMMTHGNNYWDLAPHKELLSPAWNSTPYWAYCMRTDDQTLFKLYFEKDTEEAVSGALPNTEYQAQSFNPRTGTWINVGSGTLASDAQGRIVVPACPTATEDWGLSLSTE